MATEIIGAAAGTATGAVTAVTGSIGTALATGSAFIVAHPVVMAAAGGVLLGMGGAASIGRFFSKRKQKKIAIKAAMDNMAAQAA